MSAEFYARGYQASVRHNNEEESIQFPKSSLVREQTCLSAEALLRFYSHQIAHLLFPDNFIDVTGITFSELAPPWENISSLKFSRLYSALAPVSSDHADFSSHMGMTEDRKKRTCNCLTCIRHESVHQARPNLRKLNKLFNRLEKAGIFVERDDPSDYCFNQTSGEIIFFEVFYIDLDKARKYSEKEKLRKEKKHRLIKLSKRTEVLQRLFCQDEDTLAA